MIPLAATSSDALRGSHSSDSRNPKKKGGDLPKQHRPGHTGVLLQVSEAHLKIFQTHCSESTLQFHYSISLPLFNSSPLWSPDLFNSLFKSFQLSTLLCSLFSTQCCSWEKSQPEDYYSYLCHSGLWSVTRRFPNWRRNKHRNLPHHQRSMRTCPVVPGLRWSSLSYAGMLATGKVAST